MQGTRSNSRRSLSCITIDSDNSDYQENNSEFESSHQRRKRQCIEDHAVLERQLEKPPKRDRNISMLIDPGVPQFRFASGDKMRFTETSLAMEKIKYHCREYRTLTPGCAQIVKKGETLFEYTNGSICDKFFVPKTNNKLAVAEFGYENLRIVLVQDRDHYWNSGEAAIVVYRGMADGQKQRWHVWDPTWDGDEYFHDAEYVERHVSAAIQSRTAFITLKLDPHRLAQLSHRSRRTSYGRTRPIQRRILAESSDSDAEVAVIRPVRPRTRSSIFQVNHHQSRILQVSACTASESSSISEPESDSDNETTDIKEETTEPEGGRQTDGFQTIAALDMSDQLRPGIADRQRGDSDRWVEERGSRDHNVKSLTPKSMTPAMHRQYQQYHRSNTFQMPESTQVNDVKLFFKSRKDGIPDREELLTNCSTVEELFVAAVKYKAATKETRILSVQTLDGEELAILRKQNNHTIDEEEYQLLLSDIRADLGNPRYAKLEISEVEI